MKKYNKWCVDTTTKTKDGKVVIVTLVDNGYRNKSIRFKWDGCLDLRKYYSGYTVDDEIVPDNEIGYFHICDLEEFIDELQEVLVIAKDFLDKDDYEEYYKNVKMKEV